MHTKKYIAHAGGITDNTKHISKLNAYLLCKKCDIQFDKKLDLRKAIVFSHPKDILTVT